MEMKTNYFYVRHTASLFYDFQHVAHVDTELILSKACSDVSMGVCTYIRVQTEGHTSHFILSRCQFVDNFKLWNTLNIETEDVVVQS